MAYAMLDIKTGKYAISSKKDFSEGCLLFLDDAKKFYPKIKIVKSDNDILEKFKQLEINVNSCIKDFKSKI